MAFPFLIWRHTHPPPTPVVEAYPLILSCGHFVSVFVGPSVGGTLCDETDEGTTLYLHRTDLARKGSIAFINEREFDVFFWFVIRLKATRGRPVKLSHNLHHHHHCEIVLLSSACRRRSSSSSLPSFTVIATERSIAAAPPDRREPYFAKSLLLVQRRKATGPDAS